MVCKVPHLISPSTFKESTVLYDTCAHPVLSYRNTNKRPWCSGDTEEFCSFLEDLLLSSVRPPWPFQVWLLTEWTWSWCHWRLCKSQGAIFPVVAVRTGESVNTTGAGSVQSNTVSVNRRNMYWINIITTVIQTSYYLVFGQWLAPWDADNFHSRKKNPWQIPYGICALPHSTAWLEKLLGITFAYNITFIIYTVYRTKERFKWKVLVVRIQLATDIR
jgi:hypothetical protein